MTEALKRAMYRLRTILREIPPFAAAPSSLAVGALAVATAIIFGRIFLAFALVGATTTTEAIALELAAAVTVLAAIYLTAQVHAGPAVALAVLFVLFYTANLEMVAAMDTVVNVRDLVFAADAVFVRASAAHLHFLPYALVLLALTVGWALAVSGFARRRSPPAHWARPRRITITLTVAAVGIVAVLASALTPPATSWQDDSLVARSIAQSLHRGPGVPAGDGTGGLAGTFHLDDFLGEETDAGPDAELDRALLYPRAPDGEKRNVLFVIVEGIPGVYLEQVSESSGVEYPVTMSAFSRIAERGLTLSQSVAHARQTIRGLYSVLTGDTPRLDLSSPKIYSYIAADPDERPPGLPHAMAELGYRTIYLQAADLSYMSKDLFMPEVGFEEMYGKEFFDYKHVPSEWGPDDKAYFEQVADYIDELQDDEEPWFLTLLSVGTHHPYAVPDGYEDDFPNRKIAAVAYLDEALEQFWSRLEDSGVTDDTAVFIVSDESHGVTGHSLGRYWGTTVVRVPESNEHVLRDEPFGLIDIPRSILDYLGADEHAARFAGRSVLRELDAPRTMSFGPYVAFAEDGDGNGGGAHAGDPRPSDSAGNADSGSGSDTRSGRPPYSVFEVRGERDVVRLTPATGRIFAADYERSDVPGDRTALIDRVTGAYARATLIPGVEYALAAEDRKDAMDDPGGAHAGARPPAADPEQLTLLRDSRGELSAGERKTLTTAQYLEVPAGSRVTLTLSLAAKAAENGDSGAERRSSDEERRRGDEHRSSDEESPPAIRPRLQILAEYEPLDLPLAQMPALEPGQSFELELTVPAAEALKRVWVDLSLAALDGDGTVRYAARELRFEIEPTGDDLTEASAEIQRFEIRDDGATAGLPPVAHAGGAWRGHTYTNSVEALAANAADFSLFELDFEWTSDGTLVGLHDWDVIFERLYGFRPEGPLAYERFRELDTQLGVTPVGLDDLRVFLDEHPDARIVTDVKNDNLRALAHLAEEIEDHAGRLIPQVYQPAEFAEAIGLGYRDIIWTLYRYPGNRDAERVAGHVRDFRALDEDALYAVAMPELLVREGTAERLREIGVPVYAHTINSCEAYGELRNLGASSIYTDALDIETCE